MKPCLFGMFGTLLLSSAFQVSAQQSLVPAHSEIAFTSTQMGVPVHGKFQRFNAQVAFDPKRLETSKIQFTIDMGSASFGAAELDAEVAKPAWFDAKKFPQGTFESVAVKERGGGKFDVVGRLKIKDSVRDIVVPVNLVQSTAGTTATGDFRIRRLDFGIGDGDWKDTALVSNEVLVRFRLLVSGIASR